MALMSWLGLGSDVKREPVKPYKEQGKAGLQQFGGFLVSPEKNRSLQGQEKFKTYSEIVANVSIVAASIRFYSNLLTSAKWSVEPVDDTPAAKEYAEFVERTMHGMESSWTRIIRRASGYKFSGITVNEWVAMRDADGRIVYRNIEARPPATIIRYDVDDNGYVNGFVQQSPNDLALDVYLPRAKTIFLSDDLLTDAPDGLGLLRHCAEPAERLKTYQRLEQQGFERDLRGIPVGKAPYAQLADWAGDDPDKQAIARQYAGNLEEFVKMQVRGSSTGVVLDSATYTSQSDTGQSVSSTPQWGIELLQGGTTGLGDSATAIGRLNAEMARVFGTDGILLGGENASSQALAKDKTQNLQQQIDSTNLDMADAFTKEYISPLWELNGYDDAMKPRFTVESVGKLDAQEVAGTLADLARAGLSPDDEAIDHVRQMMGVPPAPDTALDLSL